jgi:hypothetical protein
MGVANVDEARDGSETGQLGVDYLKIHSAFHSDIIRAVAEWRAEG